MTEKWYLTDDYSTKIETYEFKRSTKEYLIRKNGIRDAKATGYGVYHRTYAEARNFLINRIKNKVDYFESEIDRFKGQLEKLQSLPETEPK